MNRRRPGPADVLLRFPALPGRPLVVRSRSEPRESLSYEDLRLEFE